MDFVKLGVIKSDENLAANQIKFIPTNRNFETIKNINGFYLKIIDDMEYTSFKIISNINNYFILSTEIEINFDKFKNHEIFIKKKDLPKLPNNEFYNESLIGCIVMNSENENYGIINRILDSSNGSMIEIKLNEKIYVVPFIEHFILDINLNDNFIIIKDVEKIAALWKLIQYQSFQILLKII